MILLASINLIIILSIFGYSYLFKSIIFKNKNTFLENLDFFYGLIFLYLISLILHIFMPLASYSKPILIVGLILLIYCFIKKKLKISIVKYFIIIFLFSFIAYYGKDNVDSPLYHLQIIKWLSNYKLTFGLANLEWRLGVNYPWYSILSILNIDFFNYSNKYFFSLIFFSFLFYEISYQKKISKSFLFLSLTFSYLFFYSLIHPFNYGVILNHIGNPEKDLFNMLLFISLVYIYLKIIESKNLNNQLNLISILFIILTMTIMQTTIYIFISLVFIFMLFEIIKIRYHVKLISILSIIFIFWIFKSTAISGCLIFQIPLTCLSTEWTIDLSTLKFHIDETKRYSRSLPSLEMVGDLYKTIETFLWLKPWLKNYFLTTALHQINLIIIIFSSFIGIYLIFKKKIKFNKYEIILLISILFVNLTCLILIPEIRYYWGPHISLSVLYLSLIIWSLDIRYLYKYNFFYFIPLTTLILFIFIKVFPMFKYSDLTKLPIREHNYSFKKKVGKFNGLEVFTNSWQCADIKEICVNTPKENYNFNYIYNFLVIKNN